MTTPPDERLADVYAPLRSAVLITDPASAETIKYAANGFLAMKISFVNAIAAMCEAVGANVDDVVEGIGSDERIGRSFLKPGPGWGGSCFPKDSKALVKIAADYGYDFTMMKGVIDVNEEQRRRMVGKVRTALGFGPGGGLRGALVAVLGLTFKAGTDDLRDSPSLTMVRSLLASGAKVRAFDPTVGLGAEGTKNASLDGIELAADAIAAARGGRGPGHCHGMAGVRQARPRRGCRGDGRRRGDRRHAQPARPGCRARRRSALRRRRPPVGPTQTHSALPRTMPTVSRIVVTGGAGFLGSHLCQALLDRGDEVVAIDNLITGAAENIEGLFGERGFTFHHHDVSTYLWVPGPVDAVMHLASPASPADFERIPIQILKVGGLGTHNGLGLARAKRAKFFLASTSEVYGDPLVHPQPETYWGNVNPIGPRGVYDEAKRYAEAMTMAYHRHHGLDVRIVRIFNTFGPQMRPDDGRAVSNFMVQALRGEPITIYGDGSQTRSFTYVDDEIRGFLALLDSDVTVPVNIGNPEEYTISQLAELTRQITGSASTQSYVPLPVDDPAQRQPDITRARELLGWEPTVGLAEGLQRTAEYFRTVV